MLSYIIYYYTMNTISKYYYIISKLYYIFSKSFSPLIIHRPDDQTIREIRISGVGGIIYIYIYIYLYTHTYTNKPIVIHRLYLSLSLSSIIYIYIYTHAYRQEERLPHIRERPEPATYRGFI